MAKRIVDRYDLEFPDLIRYAVHHSTKNRLWVRDRKKTLFVMPRMRMSDQSWYILDSKYNMRNILFLEIVRTSDGKDLVTGVLQDHEDLKILW